MNVIAHPLFFVFAFLLVCIAGIWWLLRELRERAGDEQSTSPPREEEPFVMEILQDTPSATIQLAQPVSATSPKLDRKDAPRPGIRPEETKTRLAVVDELIRKQRSRITSARSMGLDVTLLEEQLKILSDSREEYFSSLKRLLSDFVDGENLNGGNQ